MARQHAARATSTGRCSGQRWVLGLALALAFTASCAFAAPALARVQAPPSPKASRDWKRFASPSFVLVGNATTGQMRLAAGELEAFRSMLAVEFPTIRFSSPVPTLVVVFKDDAAFTPFKPRDGRGKRDEWVGGYFASYADVNYLAFPAYEDKLLLTVVLHEYMHYVLLRNLTTMPTWLAEGLANFYSTFRPSTEEGHSIVGAVPQGYASVLRTRTLIPLERLMSDEGAAKIYENENEIGMFYAQSWALTHYLYLGQRGKRAKQIGAYVRALQSGMSVEKAFETAFQCTTDQLEGELRQYLHAFQLPALSTPRPSNQALERVESVPMLEADALGVQADLFVRVGAREDAEKTAGKALALDPEHPRAQFALASVRRGQDRRDEATKLLERLVEQHDVSFAAELMLASTMADAGDGNGALRHAERAVALNDKVPAAWYMLGVVRLLLGRQDEADAATEKLLALEQNPDYFRQRANLLFGLGRDAAAARDARSYLDRAGWGTENSAYVAFLGALACRRSSQDGEADRLLERIRPSVAAGSWTGKVLDFLQHRTAADKFLSLAKDDGEKTEAHTYIGFDLVKAGKRQDAITHFRWVKEHGSRNYTDTRWRSRS